MMNSAFVYSYAKMVEHGHCVIDQIPESYREAVRAYLEGIPDEEDTTETSETIEPQKTAINGALHLPNIVDAKLNQNILKSGTMIETHFRNENIFTEEILGTNPFPTDIKYTCDRVENVYGKFGEDLNVEVENSVGGFIIKVTGVPNDTNSGETMLRIDLLIQSMNYERMRITVYFVAE